MSREPKLPPGTATAATICDLILSRTGRYLDEDQWRAVARRRSLRRFSGTAYIRRKDSPVGIVYDAVPIMCWSLADVRRHLRWIGTCDERLLDVGGEGELPTVEEIYRRAAMLRGLRDMAGDVRPEDERQGWSAPEFVVRDLEG